MTTIYQFFKSKTAPGIILCIAALLALIAENSPLDELYELFKKTPVVIQIGDFSIDKPLLLWINDGLMAIFFLLIGLEVKREILIGHLSKPEQVILPAVAAAGGLIVPALIYAYINFQNPELIQGWAIPAATDIAFALGVLMILGSRIPPALKICMVAIAVIDDLAAIIIIALFYTNDLSVTSLSFAGIGILLAFTLNRMGVTRISPYMVIGVIIWACILKSGVHATLAGVIIGLLIPLKAKNKNGESPLLALEHTLYPWISFAILPLFAFVNAGVSLKGLSIDTLTHPITLGIMLGLFFGKQIGVMLLSSVFIFLKICKLPIGVTWSQFYGMAVLTGIGFTMSLFIGTLSFDNIEHASAVRLGVLGGSILSTIVGVTILILSSKKKTRI